MVAAFVVITRLAALVTEDVGVNETCDVQDADGRTLAAQLVVTE